MIAIHRFMVLMIDLGTIRGFAIFEKQGHIVIENRGFSLRART